MSSEPEHTQTAKLSIAALALAIAALVTSVSHYEDSPRHCDPDAYNGFGHCFREDGRGR